MGASASINTIVTNINNRVQNTLIQQAGASANASCTVTINSITLENSTGCTISVKNLCAADAFAQVDAVINATIDFYNDLSNEQKQEAPTWFTAAFGINTTVNNITNDFKQLIEEKCLAKSVVDSDFTTQNIIVSNCTSAPGQGIITLEFINSGKATGQCAVSALVDLQVAGSNIVANSQSQGFDWSSVIWPVSIVAIIIVSIFALPYIVNMFKKNIPTEKDIDFMFAKNNNPLIAFKYLNDSVRKNKNEK
jgi:hypothetical protein